MNIFHRFMNIKDLQFPIKLILNNSGKDRRIHLIIFKYFSSSYLDHIRQEKPVERAGGYTREYPCLRAIEEAFDMLLFVKEDSLKKDSTDENEPMET